MIIRLFVFLCVFFSKSALFIRSGKFLFGLVKKMCLPDRMSGKNLNTFANTDCVLKMCWIVSFRCALICVLPMCWIVSLTCIDLCPWHMLDFDIDMFWIVSLTSVGLLYPCYVQICLCHVLDFDLQVYWIVFLT